MRVDEIKLGFHHGLQTPSAHDSARIRQRRRLQRPPGLLGPWAPGIVFARKWVLTRSRVCFGSSVCLDNQAFEQLVVAFLVGLDSFISIFVKLYLGIVQEAF